MSAVKQAPQSQSKSRKYESPVRDAVLVALAQNKVATPSQVGTSATALKRYVEQGFLADAGEVRTGRRGRPARQFKLTAKGRGRARTLARQS